MARVRFGHYKPKKGILKKGYKPSKDGPSPKKKPY